MLQADLYIQMDCWESEFVSGGLVCGRNAAPKPFYFYSKASEETKLQMYAAESKWVIGFLA
jgi:hypothetical protein